MPFLRSIVANAVVVVAGASLLVACRGDARRDGATPVGSAVQAPADDGTLDILLDDRGVVQIGSTRLLVDDAVLAAFRAYHEHAPRGKIVIHAYRATLHGRLVRIVDLAKDADVRFEIAVVEEG